MLFTALNSTITLNRMEANYVHHWRGKECLCGPRCCHRPEKTLLYQLVSKHYPDFRRQFVDEGRVLPDYVQREFEDYLKCGRLEHGWSVAD